MTDDDENNYQSDEYEDEISLKSTNSFIPLVQEDEESLHRTPSSLNNYCSLPPIKTAANDNQQYFIKHLQEKYHGNDQHTI